MSAPAPIACTLAAGDFRERMAWIADLNGRALKRHDRADLTLTLAYDRQARRDVARLAARERECCAFLAFQVVDHGDETLLTITAPAEAREAADGLFAGFLSGQASKPACGCC